MRRWVRVCAIMLMVAAMTPMAGPARAAEATLRVDKQGWFWRHETRVTIDPLQEAENRGVVVPCPPPEPAPPVPCPSVPQRASVFEDDHLLVGRNNSAPDEADRDQAMALLLFDLSFLELDSKTSGATLALEESTDDLTGTPGGNNPTNLGSGHPNRRPGGSVNVAQAKLAACPVTDFWGGSQPTQPALWTERPKARCDLATAPGRRELVNTEGRSVPVWIFDIDRIAQLWAADPFGYQGLALVPAAGSTGDFMVSLHGDTFVVERDLVTNQDLSATLIRRVFGSMRFTLPPALEETPETEAGALLDAAGTDPGVGVLGVTLSSDPDALGVPGVNTSIGFVHTQRGPSAALIKSFTSGPASMPGYIVLPIALGIAGIRFISGLFVPARIRRPHRVATTSGRRIRPPAR